MIKSSRVISVDDIVLVQPLASPRSEYEEQAPIEAEPVPDPKSKAEQEAEALKQRLLADAESAAATIVAQAKTAADKTKQDAQREIDAWWQERRKADTEQAAKAKEDGHQQGYKKGYAQAESEIKDKYNHLIDSANGIVQQAMAIKQEMILEAEPFLIELSTSIAEKIIGRQLQMEPDWVVESIRKTLQRKRELGVISLCVAPSQFSFVQDAREELLLSIDSQAELQILPDPNVHDYGCVVRSSLGSIDARIDTQLEEIKKALLHVYRSGEGNPGDE
ncbi:FliH/SctL family protein [Paenibacillus koleovorans]|uniref:FliH/SctL family protein n=1 Tax=Paenibacillus koleovorans TaxID=121608 RepID=UPI001FE5F290|nr:FliH/SctL family protein [Paenibacillus koleovorans]